jgi:1,2-phenylacetyl-CoA epoxidase PaaB subunit
MNRHEDFIMLKKGGNVDLRELQELSVSQTKAGPKNAKLYLDKIRKNLMTLMCQTDIIELSGDLNAFGGEKDAVANISKAVFGLFCVGNILGVDVALGMEKFASDVIAKLASASISSSESGVTRRDPQADLWTTEKTADIESDTSSQSGSKSSDNKAKKIENYRRAFKSQKDKAGIELIWKNISEDEDLSGQDKYQLQNDKKEALKRVAPLIEALPDSTQHAGSRL